MIPPAKEINKTASQQDLTDIISTIDNQSDSVYKEFNNQAEYQRPSINKIRISEFAIEGYIEKMKHRRYAHSMDPSKGRVKLQLEENKQN